MSQQGLAHLSLPQRHTSTDRISDLRAALFYRFANAARAQRTGTTLRRSEVLPIDIASAHTGAIQEKGILRGIYCSVRLAVEASRTMAGRGTVARLARLMTSAALQLARALNRNILKTRISRQSETMLVMPPGLETQRPSDTHKPIGHTGEQTPPDVRIRRGSQEVQSLEEGPLHVLQLSSHALHRGPEPSRRLHSPLKYLEG